MKEKKVIYKPSSSNLIRSIKSVLKFPNYKEILKIMATQINWDEITTVVINDEDKIKEHTQTTRALVYEAIDDQTLTLLISKNIFLNQYGNYEELPFLPCLQYNKFEFLNSYLQQFFDHLQLHDPASIYHYYAMKSHLGTGIRTIFRNLLLASCFSSSYSQTINLQELNESKKWFINVYKTLIVLKSLSPYLNPGLGMSIDKGRVNSEHDSFNSTKTAIALSLYTFVYLHSPRELARNIEELSQSMPEMKDLCSEHMWQGLNIKTRKNEEVVQLRQYILNSQSVEAFEHMIGDLLKSNQIELLRQISNDIVFHYYNYELSAHYSAPSMDSRRGEEFKKAVQNSHSFVERLYGKLNIIEKFLIKSNLFKLHKHNTALEDFIINSLGAQNPTPLLQMDKINANYQFKVIPNSDVLLNLKEVAFLFITLQNIVYSHNLASPSKYLDYRDSQLIEQEYTKHSTPSLSSPTKSSLGLHSIYNVRKLQYEKICGESQAFLGYPELREFASTLGAEQRQVVLSFIQEKISELLKVKAISKYLATEVDEKIKMEIQLSLQKMQLEEGIAPTDSIKSNINRKI